jgi:hypothetical protein
VFVGATGACVVLTTAGQIVGFDLANFAATVANVFTRASVSSRSRI